MDQENITEIVRFFFTLQLNMKIYHWNTKSFARHKASDEFGGKLLPLVDKFVEVFIGKYKVKPMPNTIKISEGFVTDDGSESLLEKAREYLEKLNSKINDSELLNIRDELLGEVNQTLYLYQLK
jgi:DNA-binding ferritin-like protein